jgi:alanyl-tRNA synthetase
MEISELLAIIDPMEKMYALADHSRCLLFMLNDGLIPSNAGAGYLARLVIRRSIRMAEEIGFKLPLIELLKAHMNALKEFSFEKRLTLMDKILKSEEEKYSVTISRGIKMVERLLKKQKTISENNLVELYESHGLPPEVVKNVAMKTGVEIEIPDTFYSKLAQQHIKGEREEQELDPELIKQYPPTRKLYYEQPYQKSFEAMVLGVRGNNIILDRTLFYPEGGGQMYDTGYIQSERGSTRVIEVHEMGDIILHRVEDPSMVSIGEVIKGEIDFDRRKRHMQHHTATHIILYATKRVLGDHIWQAGARKEEDKARLDITHYRKLSREEVRKIEEIVNEIVRANIKVEWKWMDRIEAEKKYGFTLYQGGVPPGKQIRVVQIDRDVQACGGTHCSYTGEVGVIKILRADRIQDGVDRLEFAAGSAALKHIQKRDEILEESAKILRVDVEKLPDTVKRFFEEWKDQKKQIEKMVNKLARLQVKELIKRAEKIDKIRLVTEQFSDMDQQELIKIGEKLKDEKNVIAILISNGKSLRVVISVNDEVIQRGIYANTLIRVMCSTIGGGGGGKRDLAQGGGTSPEKVEEGIEKVIEYIQEKI